MESLQHTVSGMPIQKFHSPYSVRNKNIHKHYAPLFPFTHPVHEEKEPAPRNRLRWNR
jgi:hypothetical protein